jgi:hypothetical protein
MGSHRPIQDGTARGVYEGRLLSKIEAAWPDREVHYLFGGYVVVPKGAHLTCAATPESLWEKLMINEAPLATVLGTVLRSDLAVLHNGSTEEVNARAAEARAQAGRADR